MRADQTCDIIRDLLPSVSEGLTSEKTNRWVMEHLDSCPECREKYDILRASDPVESERPSADQLGRDVRFLKKIKARHWLTLVVSVIVVCALVFFGNYILREKKFYVPTSAMTITHINEMTYGYKISFSQRYSSAEKEDDVIRYYKNGQGVYQIEYSMRYSYYLWDYLFPASDKKVDMCSVQENFVNVEFPEMDPISAPSLIVVIGKNPLDRNVLWSNLDIVSATQKIAQRFMYGAKWYDAKDMEKLTKVYEMKAFVLNNSKYIVQPWHSSLGEEIIYSLADGTAYSYENTQAIEDFLYNAITSLRLSSEDLEKLVHSAKIYVTTAETTAAKVPNIDAVSPEDIVTIVTIRIYTDPEEKIQNQVSAEMYVGNGYIMYSGSVGNDDSLDLADSGGMSLPVTEVVMP